MKTVYLGLGSNLGNREEMLQRAIGALDSAQLRIRRVSPVFETEPMYLAAQAWFLNLVVEAETTLFPLQLLQRTRKVEAQLGRRRTMPNGPRTIDIDILLYGDVIMHTTSLEIPHPGLRERRFVLEPLAALAPALRDPVSRRTVRELLAALPPQNVRRVRFQPEWPRNLS